MDRTLGYELWEAMNNFKVGDRASLKDLDCEVIVVDINIPRPYPEEGTHIKVKFFDKQYNCLRYLSVIEEDLSQLNSDTTQDWLELWDAN